MKGFSVVFFTAFLLGSVYGVQLVQPSNIGDFAEGLAKSLNPKLANVATTLNALAANKKPIDDLNQLPAALNVVLVAVKSIGKDMGELMTLTVNYANQPRSSMSASEFPRTQVQPYLNLFPTIRSQMSQIVTDVNQLMNTLDNKSVWFSDKLKGTVNALPLFQGMQILKRLGASVQQIVTGLQNAQKQSIKAEPEVSSYGIMTNVNGAISQVIPAIQLLADAISNTANAFQVGVPNARGLVSVDFAKALTTVNGYIAKIPAAVNNIEKLVNTMVAELKSIP